jgi:hypothetical protein
MDGKSKWRIGEQQGRQAQMIPMLDSMIVHMEEAMSSTKMLLVAIKAYMLRSKGNLHVVSALVVERFIVVILRLLVTTTLQHTVS